MAEVIGVATMLRRALPTGADGTRIAQWQLRSGKTYRQWVNEVAYALEEFNNDMIARWGWLFFLTELQMMEYPDGGSVTRMQDLPDTDRIDPRHGTTISHMIDLIAKGDSIGGTRRWMRDAREAQFDADLLRIVSSAQWRFEYDLLDRWFTNTENSIGSNGYDVPFVRGTGGNVDFAPPTYGGEAFTTSHTHYLGVDSDNYGYGDMLNQLAETVQEHGHEPPYIALVARADISTYYDLPDFTRPISPQVIAIDRATTTANTGAAFFSNQTREFGVIGAFKSEYGDIEVRATSRVPTTYAGLVKSYGNLSQRNPLAVRVHPDVGFGAYLVPETLADVEYPIKQIDVEFEYGQSCGRDRTAGAAAYISEDGTWSNPTIV